LRKVIPDHGEQRTAALREINLHNADAEWLWDIQAKLDDHFGKPIYLVDASVDEWRDTLQPSPQPNATAISSLI